MIHLKTFALFAFCCFWFQTTLFSQFVYDNKSVYAEDEMSVQPPIPDLQPAFLYYSITAEKGAQLNVQTDTKITIPADAFVDKNGHLVKGVVDIHYRDFNNPLDIFLSGIPMTIEENGKEEFFQSAAMVEFRASQNDVPVYPNPKDNKLINIELTSTQIGDSYHLYALNERSGEWLDVGPSEVLGNDSSAFDASQFQFNDFYLPPPVLETSSVSIQILNRNRKYWIPGKKRNLQFTIQEIGRFANYLNVNSFHKKFDEFNKKKPTVWIYDGPDKKAVKQLLKTIIEANESYEDIDSLKQYVIKDIRITPNRPKDNYLITFECTYKTVTLEAYPYLSYNPSLEQKRNASFYKKYESAYDVRCEKWKEIDSAYWTKKERYENELVSSQNTMTDSLGNNIPEKTVRRRIGVFTFGILNIDKIMKRMTESRMLAFNLKAEKKCEVLNIYVLDNTNNGLFSYSNSQLVRFDGKAKNSLIVELEDHSFAMISPSTFKSVFKKSKGLEMVFTLEHNPSAQFTHKTLSDALASR